VARKEGTPQTVMRICDGSPVDRFQEKEVSPFEVFLEIEKAFARK